MLFEYSCRQCHETTINRSFAARCANGIMRRWADIIRVESSQPSFHTCVSPCFSKFSPARNYIGHLGSETVLWWWFPKDPAHQVSGQCTPAMLSMVHVFKAQINRMHVEGGLFHLSHGILHFMTCMHRDILFSPERPRHWKWSRQQTKRLQFRE